MRRRARRRRLGDPRDLGGERARLDAAGGDSGHASRGGSDRGARSRGRADRAHRSQFPRLGGPRQPDRQAAPDRPQGLPDLRRAMPAQPLRHARGRHRQLRGSDPHPGHAHRPAAGLPLGRQAVRADPLPGGQDVRPLPRQLGFGLLGLLRPGSAHHLSVRPRGLPLDTRERPQQPVCRHAGLPARQGSHPGPGHQRRARVHGLGLRRAGAGRHAASRWHRRRSRGRDPRPLQPVGTDDLHLRDEGVGHRPQARLQRLQRLRPLRARPERRPVPVLAVQLLQLRQRRHGRVLRRQRQPRPGVDSNGKPKIGRRRPGDNATITTRATASATTAAG